jgi:hypothetical protein
MWNTVDLHDTDLHGTDRFRIIGRSAPHPQLGISTTPPHRFASPHELFACRLRRSPDWIFTD